MYLESMKLSGVPGANQDSRLFNHNHSVIAVHGNETLQT